MTFQERSAAVTIGALVVIFGAYFAVLVAGVDRRVDDFVYKPLLVLAVIALTVVMAASHTVLALWTPHEANNPDERDRAISQRGDQIGGMLLGATTIGVVLLAALEVAHVYIANALLLGLVLAQVASEGAKLWLSRRPS